MSGSKDFEHWFAGFAAGEGCFTITKRSDSAGAVVCFQIKLRDDDAEILYECQKRFGGTIIFAHSGKPKWGDQVIWRVRDTQACVKLVALFDRRPLRAKKQDDFVIWREAVLLRAQASKHLGNGKTKERNAHIWSRMAELKQQLEQGRKYVRTRNH